jgi:hypothetical protein
MIYVTTFFLTLFVIQFSRALPQACGDHISPASDSVQHRLPYGDSPQALVSVQPPICDPKYDNPNTSMHTVACADLLEKRYPLFGDIPNFPFIGGVYDIRPNSSNCGECWKFTNKDGVHIYLTAIDSAPFGFVMSVAACSVLKVGEVKTIEKVLRHFCEFPP